MKVADRHRWVKLFLEAMVDAPKRLWHPVVVIVDEAHVFAPEKGAGESEAADAMICLATRGRKRGFAAVLATQRLGKLRKDVAAECANALIGQTFLDVDRDARMLAEEFGERLRQIFRQTGRVGEQMHAGPRATGKGGEIAAHRLDIVDDDAGVIEHAFAGGRQLDAAAAAGEQGNAEALLQPLDPLAGRCQRQMHTLRPTGDAAGFRHRDEARRGNGGLGDLLPLRQMRTDHREAPDGQVADEGKVTANDKARLNSWDELR